MRTPIALQLYSVRREPASALPRVLERLAALGFDGVEPAGLWSRSPSEFRRCCESFGLRIAAVHEGFALDADPRRELEAAAELGVDDVVLPLVEATGFRDLDAVQRTAEAINRIAQVASGYGLRLGYHNHEWEFSSRIDGAAAHRHLFEALDGRVFAELDVYWAQVGGADPAAEVQRFGERARLLHLKDGPATDVEARMTALGAGAVDLRRVLERSRAHWHVIEIDDCVGDVWDAIAASHAYLTREMTP